MNKNKKNGGDPSFKEMKGRKKDPEFKKEDLIKLVVQWTATGVNKARQLKNIQEMGYSPEYGYQIFRDAKPLINEVLKDIAKELLEETLTELRRMKMEAEDNKDYHLTLMIQKEINKISGLDQQKIDLTTNGKSIENISVIKLVEVLKDANENPNNK